MLLDVVADDVLPAVLTIDVLPDVLAVDGLLEVRGGGVLEVLEVRGGGALEVLAVDMLLEVLPVLSLTISAMPCAKTSSPFSAGCFLSLAYQERSDCQIGLSRGSTNHTFS